MRRHLQFRLVTSRPGRPGPGSRGRISGAARAGGRNQKSLRPRSAALCSARGLSAQHRARRSGLFLLLPATGPGRDCRPHSGHLGTHAAGSYFLRARGSLAGNSLRQETLFFLRQRFQRVRSRGLLPSRLLARANADAVFLDPALMAAGAGPADSGRGSRRIRHSPGSGRAYDFAGYGSRHPASGNQRARHAREHAGSIVRGLRRAGARQGPRATTKSSFLTWYPMRCYRSSPSSAST